MPARWADTVHHPGSIDWIAFNRRVDVLQPAIPPAQSLLQEANSWLRRSVVRILVYPRPHDALHWRLNVGDDLRHCVPIAVVPSTYCQNRRLDPGEILADRAALPIGVAALMRQPEWCQERLMLQAIQPHFPPPITDQRRIWRPGRVGQHRRAPTEVFIQQAASLVVDVVGVAIDGRAERYNGLERRRLQRRNLRAVEATPGNANHADPSRAPRLRRQPSDHIDCVLPLLIGVFVVHEPFGITVSAHIDTHGGVAVTGKIGMRQAIALRGAFAFAIGNVFEDRRNGILLGIDWHPDARRQHAAVRHRDPYIRILHDFSREVRNNLHSLPSAIVAPDCPTV